MTDRLDGLRTVLAIVISPLVTIRCVVGAVPGDVVEDRR